MSFPDQEYKQRYEFVPYGLVSVLSRKERPPSLEAYVLESRQAWATALNEMRRLPLDENITRRRRGSGLFNESSSRILPTEPRTCWRVF